MRSSVKHQTSRPQSNRKVSSSHATAKTTESVDLSKSKDLLPTPQKERLRPKKSSPRSVCSTFPSLSTASSDEDACSTDAIASPPRKVREIKRTLMSSVVRNVNQACKASKNLRHRSAMRLLQDAHCLLHLQMQNDLENEAGMGGEENVSNNGNNGHDQNSLHLQCDDVDFVSTNSYIYQRLEFDEGMCTYMSPIEIESHEVESFINDKIALESIIWYNKGHIYRHYHHWEQALDCFETTLGNSVAIRLGNKSKAGKGSTNEMNSNEHVSDRGNNNTIKLQSVFIAALHSIAQIQYRLEKYKEAIATYTRAIKISKHLYGESHPTIGAALNSLSVLYYHLMSLDSQKNYLQYARNFSQQALEIRLQTLGCNHPDVATTYNNIGRLYVMQDKFQEALKCYEKALKIRAKTLGKDSLDYAATAFNAGQSYHHIHELDKAIAYYHDFLEVAVKHFTKDHRDVAVVLSGIAEIHQERGEFDQALKLYEESLEAAKNALGEDHPEVAMILNRLGNFHYVTEDYDAAYEVYSRGLEIEKRVLRNGHTNSIVSLCNLGEIHRQRKEWDAAIKIFKKVLKIQRKRFGKYAQNADIATTLHVIGLTCDKKGESDVALKYLQEALLMRRVCLGDDHIDATHTLTSIGIIFSRDNRLTLAMDLLREALQIRSSKLGKVNRDVAFTLYNIALIHQKQGSLIEAINCFLEVLIIEKQLLGEEHKDVAITLFKLGETHKKHNHLDKALEFFQDALRVERKVMQENDPLTMARTLTEIGNIHLSRGSTVPMMEAFIEAARIYRAHSMSASNVAVNKNLYAFDLACPRGAPAA